MRLLCVYKHYWPDAAPYGLILKNIAEHLADEGHDVVVFTAQPTYNDVRKGRQPWKEIVNGVKIYRMPLLPERKSWMLVRLINLLLFLCGAFVFGVVRWHRFSLMLFNSTPPILPGVMAQLLKLFRGTKYIYHCQDVHPESLDIAGKIRSRWVFNTLRAVEKSTCNRAEVSIALSEDMRNTMLKRGITDDKVVVMTNFSARTYETTDVALPEPFDRDEGRFRILFAGNIGNYQNLDEIGDAILQVGKHDGIQWVFMGEGAAKKRLMERASELIGTNVFFIPQQHVEVAYTSMQRAELGLVSLCPNVYHVAFPTKTLMYLEAGCPILGIIEQDSQLAKMIAGEKLGYSCPSGDAQTIAETVLRAYDERAQWDTRGRDEIRQAGERLFGRDTRLRHWTQLLEKLEGEQGSIAEAVQPATASTFPRNAN